MKNRQANHGVQMSDGLIKQVNEWIDSLTCFSMDIESNKEEILVSGIYHGSYFFEEYEITLADEFNIIIHIPKDYPLKLPEIEEVDGKIPEDFHMNGKFFCLAVPIEMYLYASEKPIDEFINRFLNSYLCTYIWYQKYGFFIYGEKGHGDIGKIEFLRQYFEVEDVKAIISLLRSVLVEMPKHYEICSCGSGKKFKKCHRDKIECLKIKVPRNELSRTYEEVIRYVKDNNS